MINAKTNVNLKLNITHIYIYRHNTHNNIIFINLATIFFPTNHEANRDLFADPVERFIPGALLCGGGAYAPSADRPLILGAT